MRASRSTPKRGACASAPARGGRTSCHSSSELGLAALHGSSPDVGIAGYSLGGGMGWLRAQARAADQQRHRDRAGHRRRRPRRADAEHEPDLFWALRGGGGNFGVVTAIEFARRTRSRELYAGAMFFPLERTSEVLHAWNAAPARAAGGAHVLGRPCSTSPTLPDRARADLRGARSRSCMARLPRGRGRRPRAAAPPCAGSGRSWTRSPWCPRSGSASWRWTRRDPLPY